MEEYKKFTDQELVKAVELMICKDDLKIRQAAEALLSVFDYTAAEIQDQLESGEYLNSTEPLMLAI